ncbi:hypothetical protein [uncultured Tateyamaria sp.]|uniref:hypothetical protein n=1 Tax=uncultured Tateyamaria sp. TaxID=455651 RepID=UPI00261701FB|nr:hypothetical protein [uncultured Tateyamaria sp.]
MKTALSKGSLWVRVSAMTALVLLTGCGPRIEVQSPDGMALMDVRRGVCFVGCNIQARLPDGTTCRGFTVQLEYDRPFAANIYCPDVPTATLQVETAQRHGTSVGTLSPNANLFSNKSLDIDAIVDAHVPTPET